MSHGIAMARFAAR